MQIHVKWRIKRENRSNKLVCRGSEELKKWSKHSKNLGVYFGYMGGGAKSSGRIVLKFFLEEDIPDIITCFKFGDDRLRGLASAEGQILPFPIDFDGRPYNTPLLHYRVSVW